MGEDLGILEFDVVMQEGENSPPPFDFFQRDDPSEDLPSLSHIRAAVRHLHSLSYVSESNVVSYLSFHCVHTLSQGILVEFGLSAFGLFMVIVEEQVP